MDASLLGGEVLLLNMNFKNKWQIAERKNEKNVFVLKHVHVILRKVQKRFHLEVNTRNNYNIVLFLKTLSAACIFCALDIMLPARRKTSYSLNPCSI